MVLLESASDAYISCPDRRRFHVTNLPTIVAVGRLHLHFNVNFVFNARFNRAPLQRGRARPADSLL